MLKNKSLRLFALLAVAALGSAFLAFSLRAADDKDKVAALQKEGQADHDEVAQFHALFLLVVVFVIAACRIWVIQAFSMGDFLLR